MILRVDLCKSQMTQSGVYQKYKLSVVSGGRPILPRGGNTSCCNKSQACLTPDELGYIIPFNNQIKVYSVETRQCIKTLKFGNNGILSKIFANDDTCIAHISIGDITSQDSDDDRKITVFTNDGSVIVLNYRGKLIDSPKYLNIKLAENETICKVFGSKTSDTSDSKEFKILTAEPTFSFGSQYTYRLYSLRPKEEMKIALEQVVESVILSSWSQNDKLLAFLYYKEKRKQFMIMSVFEKTSALPKEFDFQSILTSQDPSSTSSNNSRYITSMALDSDGSQLALGFASGVITVVTLEDLQTRVLKWHIDSVLSLSFTQDGTYLLSGGWEKVLSFWQLSTNLQQFLPRLNGVIVDCQPLGNDKYYSIALQMTENFSSSDFQLLLLNSGDLTSRVSINGPLPVFNSVVKNTVQPFSAISSKASTTVSAVNNSKKKHKKKLLKSKRQDYTTCAEINPLSKHIYFPHISAMQMYDFYKNEQVSYQYMTSGINNSMGKVRFELNIKDPEVVNVKFTKNGKWMITYEVEYPPEDLLSSKDLLHTLKFWSQEDNDVNWTLKTKVINPHSTGVPVTSILPAPHAINGSKGFLTADNAGGLKYWSFQENENNWCLVKLSLPNFNHFSNSVSLAWSQDGSLIFHGFDEKLLTIDFDTFAPFEGSGNIDTINEFNLDSEIQAIKVINNTNLIVATRTTLNTINILQGQMVNSFDLFPYVNGVYKKGHLDRLIACDEKTGRVALVINQQYEDSNLKLSMGYKARIVIFNADLSEKLGIFTHEEYIAWIGWNHDTDFIFVDIGSRLGVVGTTINTEMLDEVDKDILLNNLQPGHQDFKQQLLKLSSSKLTEGVIDHDQEDDLTLELINGNKNEKLINMNSFTNMFENIQNVQMDTLFDRVMKVIT